MCLGEFYTEGTQVTPQTLIGCFLRLVAAT